ncbi:conjugal transfer protein TraN [Escherichia coli]|uniref:conjugal transfer protein TraN n=1 Tax=Escherichia coli TaxID=562 RepID=UPI000F0AC4D9|nr:conjugal transfer protein TraN [Escherichia coli]
MKRRLWLLMLFLFAGHVPAASADSACEGRFVNPITDICWSCIFPLSLGSIKVSQGKVPDTANPSMPIQICPALPPLFRRIGLAKCSSDEKALAKAKSNKLTVSVGEFCSKKVLGVCLEKKRSYCQFDSKLAQIVQQQGRNGQLRISFGSAKHPDCRGITVDELQKIQFNRLDFTNFYEDLMNNQKIPDSGVLTQKVKEQIADQLKQAGQ